MRMVYCLGFRVLLKENNFHVANGSCVIALLASLVVFHERCNEYMKHIFLRVPSFCSDMLYFLRVPSFCSDMQGDWSATELMRFFFPVQGGWSWRRS
jgi:hypothetical protein